MIRLYVSGWCGVGMCWRCIGIYAGTVCHCPKADCPHLGLGL